MRIRLVGLAANLEFRFRYVACPNLQLSRGQKGDKGDIIVEPVRHLSANKRAAWCFEHFSGPDPTAGISGDGLTVFYHYGRPADAMAGRPFFRFKARPF